MKGARRACGARSALADDLNAVLRRYCPRAEVRDISLYRTALVHPSCVRGGREKRGDDVDVPADGPTGPTTESYDRMEFLGDSVIDLVAAEHLYRTFPGRDEGFLTRMRSSLVNGATLARLCEETGISRLVTLPASTAAADARVLRGSRALLEDSLEAFVGALFLDAGWAVAREWVSSLLFSTASVVDVAALAAADAQPGAGRTGPKARLRARLGGRRPTYGIVGIDALPGGSREFTAVVRCGDQVVGSARGLSRAEAEAAAARDALAHLPLR